MTTELIILSAIVVASVIAHYFFWRSSKKHFEECMRQAKALEDKLEELTVNDMEIDRMLDDAESDVDRMGEVIDALRSVWFMKGKRDTIDN